MIRAGRIFTASVLLFLGLNANQFAFGDLTYTAYRLTAPPDLNACWQSQGWRALPEATGFRALGGNEGALLPLKQSAFRIGWDSQALYIGIECYEPDIKKVISKLKDGDALYSEDSVELFLSPVYPNYEQLVVNTAGNRSWRNHTNDDWSVVTSCSNNSWAAKFRIAFSALGGTPRDGDTWRFNVARNIYIHDTGPGGDRYTTWSPLKVQFHEIENFAKLRFSALSITDKEAADFSQLSEKGVKEQLMTSVLKIVSKCKARITLLKKSSAETGADQEIRNLEQAVVSIQQQCKDEKIPVRDLQNLYEKTNVIAGQINSLQTDFLLR